MQAYLPHSRALRKGDYYFNNYEIENTESFVRTIWD